MLRYAGSRHLRPGPCATGALRVVTTAPTVVLTVPSAANIEPHCSRHQRGGPMEFEDSKRAASP